MSAWLNLLGFLFLVNSLFKLKTFSPRYVLVNAFLLFVFLSGERYIAKSLRDSKLLQEIERKHEEIHEKLSSLSQKELKTLKLVSQKFSSKEIAELLFVSNKSVENYRSRICKKLMLDARNNSLLLWVLDHKELIEEYREEK